MDNVDTPVPPDASKVSAVPRAIRPAFGLGRFAPFNREEYDHYTGIRPFWGRIVVWLLVLAVLAWVGVASGLYAFVKYRRGFTDVQYSHMLLLPWKLDDYRRSKGVFLIEEGMAKGEAQEWRAAFGLLRTGLLAVPEHREARLLVARIYLMAGRPDVTRTTLLDGLTHHGDQLDYVREVLGYFFGLQADETVIALTRELRTRLDPEAPVGRMTTTALAYAYFNRGRYAEAEETLREARLLGTPEGRFVSARIAWAKGRHEEALVQLRELTAAVPQDQEIYRTLIYYLGEKGRWAEARRAAWMRQLALPERPEAYRDYIVASGELGDEAGRVEAESAYLERFADDEAALLRLGEQASRAGRVALAERVAARCRELGRNESEAALLVLGAEIERGAYAQAIMRGETLAVAAAAWPERQRLIFDGLRAVAFYGLKREAEAEPLARRLWESRLLPPPTLTAMAVQLERVGQPERARRVLRHAVEMDPLNQPALVRLVEGALKDGQLDEAPVWIGRLLEMRQPPVALLEELAKTLDSDRYLFRADRDEALTKVKAFLVERAEATGER